MDVRNAEVAGLFGKYGPMALRRANNRQQVSQTENRFALGNPRGRLRGGGADNIYRMDDDTVTVNATRYALGRQGIGFNGDRTYEGRKLRDRYDFAVATIAAITGLLENRSGLRTPAIFAII